MLSFVNRGFPGLLSDSRLRVRIGKTQRTRLVFRNFFFLRFLSYYFFNHKLDSMHMM